MFIRWKNAFVGSSRSASPWGTLTMRYVLEVTISRCIALSDQPRPTQLGGQPVEQLGMARLSPHGAEVIGRLDDPFAEMMLPEPVDQHARQQRIGRRVDHLRAPARAGRCPRR